MSRLQELIQRLCPEGVEYIPVGELCTVSRGRVMSKDYIKENAGPYPVYSSQTENNGELGHIATYDYEGEYVTWTTDGANAGSVFYRNEKFSITNVCGLLTAKNSTINTRFLYFALSTRAKSYVNSGMGNPKLMSNVMAKIKVPVPPLEVQQEIVQILDQFTQLTAELTAELTARKKQFTFYKTTLFQQALKATVKYLDEISENCDNLRKPVTSGNRTKGDYPYYGASGIVDYVDSYIFDGDYLLVSEDGANLLARSTPIAFSITGKNWVNNHAHVLRFEEYATRRYVEFYLNAMDLSPYVTGGAQPKLNQKNLNRIPISLPPLPEQRRIVAILDRFDALCNDLTSGLPAEIAARQKQYEYYRDKLLAFKERAYFSSSKK